MIAWDPTASEFTDEWFTAAMRSLEWGDLYFDFPVRPEAESGDNFYLVRTGTQRNGIVAKGFFLSDPYLKSREAPHTYRMGIRPTLMVQWCHEKGILELDGIRNAIPEFPDPKDSPCQEIPAEGVKKLSALWSYYLSRFDEEDYLDCLLERSERPVAGIDEAVSVASEGLFDKVDIDDRPLILNPLAVGLAGRTDDEKICGFLHLVMDSAPWNAGRLRDAGFQEKIVDALCLLCGPKPPDYERYIKRIASSGNPLAINVKINDIRCRLRDNSERHSITDYKRESAALTRLLEAARQAAD